MEEGGKLPIICSILSTVTIIFFVFCTYLPIIRVSKSSSTMTAMVLPSTHLRPCTISLCTTKLMRMRNLAASCSTKALALMAFRSWVRSMESSCLPSTTRSIDFTITFLQVQVQVQEQEQ